MPTMPDNPPTSQEPSSHSFHNVNQDPVHRQVSKSSPCKDTSAPDWSPRWAKCNTTKTEEKRVRHVSPERLIGRAALSPFLS